MRTRVYRQTGLLVAGTVAGGVLAYAFFAMVTRTLGATGAAPVSVLWTYWTIAAAVLTFPLQHWTIRLLTGGSEGAVARSQGRIWLGTAALSALSFLVAYLARDVLFRDTSVAYPLMVGAVTAGATLSGLTRGSLAGRRRFGATAASMAGENVVRVLLGAGVALAGGGGRAFGLALIAGPLSAFFWPSSLRFGRDDDPNVDPIRSPLALVSGLAAGSLIAQVAYSFGPVALAVLRGAPEEITFLFISLAVWRAPYLIFYGIAPQVTAFLTGLNVSGQDEHLRRTRRWVGAAVILGAIAAFGVGATIMNPVLRVVFSPDVVLDWKVPALVGVGAAFAVGNLILMLMMLATGTSRPVNKAWLSAIAVAGIVLVIGELSPLDRVLLAYLIAQLVAFVVLLFTPLKREESQAMPDAEGLSPSMP